MWIDGYCAAAAAPDSTSRAVEKREMKKERMEEEDKGEKEGCG